MPLLVAIAPSLSLPFKLETGTPIRKTPTASPETAYFWAAERVANALCDARAGLERHAMTLHAETALDVWKLITMTMNRPENDRIDYSADAVIVRAHREANTNNMVAGFDQAAGQKKPK